MTKSPWSLTTDTDFMQLISNIQGKAVPLSKVANIFNGIQTSAERPEKFSDKKEVYWFDCSCKESEDENSITINRFGKQYNIEKNILKTYFKPTKASEKGMSTYSVLTTDKHIIFPYDVNGKLIDIGTAKELMKKTKVKKQEYLESIKIVNYDAVLERIQGASSRKIQE